MQRLPTFKQVTIRRESPDTKETPSASSPHLASEGDDSSVHESTPDKGLQQPRNLGATSLIENFVGRDSKDRNQRRASSGDVEAEGKATSRDKQKLVKKLTNANVSYNQDEQISLNGQTQSDAAKGLQSIAVNDFNERIAEQQPAQATKLTSSSSAESADAVSTERAQGTIQSSNVVKDAFDRMRPRRNLPEVATVTIGSKTITSTLGSSPASRKIKPAFPPLTPRETKFGESNHGRGQFSSSIKSFAAPGSDLIKTVGRPQSKSRLSFKPRLSASGDEVDDRLHLEATSSDDEESEIDETDDIAGVDVSHVRQDRSSPTAANESDEDILDEAEKKANEEAKVGELIRLAEESAAIPSQDNRRRAQQLLKGTKQLFTTTNLIQVMDTSIESIEDQTTTLSQSRRRISEKVHDSIDRTAAVVDDSSPEERLSLTVSKADFATMQIAGQFNLGFILANRNNTDLFIVDQHASDEKYNFERLQSTASIESQRLVHARVLELTAIEEEIILEHNDVLLKNGFVIDIDDSGACPVGERCKLISLPLSREAIFDISDLEELLSLLAESESSVSNENIPRPSKVRRMLAMRACRSSVMIGRTLTLCQMGALVKKMGEVDKPWNCPHGRPTMRHVCGFDGWEAWSEGDGLAGLEEEREAVGWGAWITRRRDESNMIGTGQNGSGEEQSGEEEEWEREEQLADHDNS